MKFDKEYWSTKYRNKTTGWDAGGVTTPIKEYVDQIADKDLKILIPGCGYGHEAVYLFNKGFHNLYILDLSEEPLESLKARIPNLPDDHFLNEDFFEHQGTYDLILEQTFLSALPPDRREDYAVKMNELLNADGKLVGVLFGVPMNTDHPPFGGSLEEYERLFEDKFRVHTLAPCYNSIPPRQGAEIFINLQKD